MYRLGTLSKAEPAPLALAAVARMMGRNAGFEIALQRSDFAYYSDDVFREDNLGGIPVLRVRCFASHQDELNRFVETAHAHKGEPVIVVDVRGNGGGNEKWPIQWIQGLTGRRAESVFITSELHSKTTMAGRANMFAYTYDLYPDMDSFPPGCGMDSQCCTGLRRRNAPTELDGSPLSADAADPERHYAHHRDERPGRFCRRGVGHARLAGGERGAGGREQHGLP